MIRFSACTFFAGNHFTSTHENLQGYNCQEGQMSFVPLAWKRNIWHISTKFQLRGPLTYVHHGKSLAVMWDPCLFMAYIHSHWHRPPENGKEKKGKAQRFPAVHTEGISLSLNERDVFSSQGWWQLLVQNGVCSPGTQQNAHNKTSSQQMLLSQQIPPNSQNNR